MRPVVVDATTQVVPVPSGRGLDIRRHNPDGSTLVIRQRPGAQGRPDITGFRETERAGVTTRVYADGKRHEQTPDRDIREMRSGVRFVTRRDGLREALLPDGRPVYRDRYVMVRGPAGTPVRAIERTRYVRWVGNRSFAEPRPVVRYYDAVTVRGAPVGYYRPLPPTYGFYANFYAPLPTAVVIAALGVAAAPVIFSAPQPFYNDPSVLMGDMQISSGFEDGSRYAWQPDGQVQYPAPDSLDVQRQVQEVRQQVSTQVNSDANLKQQIGGDVLASSPQVQQQLGGAVPVAISEEVREQVRKQVRLSVAMLQNGHPLVLGDVLTSGYASVYLFQVAQPIWVPVEASTGSECLLNTGDLIGFSTLPGPTDAQASMAVVAASASSCVVDEVVKVPMAELQEMLNGFMIRVEDNLKKVSACAATGRC